LLALLAPLLNRRWLHLPTLGRPDVGFQMGKEAMALWATGKESLTGFPFSAAERAAIRLTDTASTV
jgi:hypothetical protein